jgi:hypothetical protein
MKKPTDDSNNNEKRHRRVQELQAALEQCRKEVDCGDCRELSVDEHIRAVVEGREISD